MLFSADLVEGRPQNAFPCQWGCPSIVLGGGGEGWGGPRKPPGCRHWAETNTPWYWCVSLWERRNSNHLLPQDFLQHNLGFPVSFRLAVMSPVSQALQLAMCLLWWVCRFAGCPRVWPWGWCPCVGLAQRDPTTGPASQSRIEMVREHQLPRQYRWLRVYCSLDHVLSLSLWKFSTWSHETVRESQGGDFLKDVLSCNVPLPLLQKAIREPRSTLFKPCNFKLTTELLNTWSWQSYSPEVLVLRPPSLCKYLHRYICLQFVMYFAKAVSISWNRHLKPWTFTFLSTGFFWSIHAPFVCVMERLLSLGQKEGNICHCLFGLLIFWSVEQNS